MKNADFRKGLKIRCLEKWAQKSLKIFAKILQKNLEDKKKSVSLQPV